MSKTSRQKTLSLDSIISVNVREDANWRGNLLLTAGGVK